MKRILFAVLAAALFSSVALAAAGGKIYTDAFGLQHWLGLSTDTKPTPTTTPLIPIGSEYIESDTRQRYVVNTAGAWEWVGPWEGGLNVILPGEDTNINRLAFVHKDACTRYTADLAAIKTGAGVVTGIIVETLAASTDDFILYDNTAASGTVLFQLTNMPATSTIGPIVVPYTGAFATGLTLDVTLTAGSSVTVCML